MTTPADRPAAIAPGDLCRERFRQIHLDFHTSPHIPDVGAEFDAEVFAATLADARVNWVTLFGKCHHGMSYYPTKVGVVHPSLKVDLLGGQIEACRRRGIVTPVYISVRVDQHTAETQPGLIGWKAGETMNHWSDEKGAGWYNLCMNHPDYVDYLIAQAEEVIKLYDPEGFFFDMCYYINCVCPACNERIRKAGGSIDDPAAVQRKEFEVTREYTRRIAAAVRALKPNATLFFNGRVSPAIGRELDVFTHLEIESLPTGGWGYQFFPFHVRYARTLGHPTQGMTARFHKGWADFGGLKTAAQFEYEAGLLLASGSVMNVGDQLHPRGRLDKAVYQAIGDAFRHVEAREPWCRDAEPVAELAVLLLNEKPGMEPAPTPGAEGATAMLLEMKQQFDIALPDGDWSNYRALILADAGPIDDALQAKLSQYLEQGGSLIVSHEATLDPATKAFRCPGLPVDYIEPFPFAPCYAKPGAVIGEGLPDADFDYVLYDGATSVQPKSGAFSYGALCTSYFNRTAAHFCSHRQTPVDQATGRPLVVQQGRVVYVAAPLFSGYRRHNYLAYKAMFRNILRLVLPDPLLTAHAPGAMEISLTRQPAEDRVIAHLVNYQPQRRQGDIEYIDDAWPLQNIRLALRADRAPREVYLAPTGEKLPFRIEDGYIHATVPEMLMHAMVVFQF
ncbi:MAG: alpha-amylase family protein [Armatimonadota bacterium]